MQRANRTRLKKPNISNISVETKSGRRDHFAINAKRCNEAQMTNSLGNKPLSFHDAPCHAKLQLKPNNKRTASSNDRTEIAPFRPGLTKQTAAKSANDKHRNESEKSKIKSQKSNQ